MPYLPPRCERFSPGLEGWICCGCGTFTGKKIEVCKCGHQRCEVLLETYQSFEKVKNGKGKAGVRFDPGPRPTSKESLIALAGARAEAEE